ncbi:MAG TPA: lipopolysaccharide core heptose(I) kinase RfaP [Pseudomonadales bacterium]|nr:lipopolysaccharide core heptose(I) kinase RfaP [Pseudomonadales bacterium]
MDELHVDEPLAAFWDGQDPFAWLAAATGERFRDLPTRRTFRFEVDGEGFFAKLHLGVGWGEIVRNLLQLRLPVVDARRERDAIAALQAARVPTPTTVAWGVRGRDPARRRSFIVTREVPTQFSLDDLARRWGELGRCEPALKHRLIRQVAELTRRMHDAGINHRDLYLVHWLLPGTPGADDALCLIDLHRAQLRARVPRRWRVKDLGSLLFSARVAPLTRADRLRFVRAYRGEPLRALLPAEAGFWAAVGRRADRLWAEGLRKGVVRAPRVLPGAPARGRAS